MRYTLQANNQNMYNRSIYCKVLFWKPPHIYINVAIIDRQIYIFVDS